MRFFLSLLFICIFSIVNGQNDEIKNTNHIFFEGMQTGDTVTLKKSIHKSLTLQTVFLNKEGKGVLKNQTKEQFLKLVSSKKKENTWFEKLLSYKINIDGDLATVWMPYEFYFNEKFSHCGTNSFQLFKNNGHWEIISIVDTRRIENCNLLKDKYLN